MNECWRLAKYVPGASKFAPHCDTWYKKRADEMSFFTVNVYMNSGYSGGATRFYASGDQGPVDFACGGGDTGLGTTGAACVFRQPVARRFLHDGQKVTSGVKYLFRSDVMYRRVAAHEDCAVPVHSSSECLEASPVEEDL